MMNNSGKGQMQGGYRARSLDNLDEGAGSDVILIGPQVRYALKSVKEKYPDIPVDTIDMRMYGLMDAKGVIALAE